MRENTTGKIKEEVEKVNTTTLKKETTVAVKKTLPFPPPSVPFVRRTTGVQFPSVPAVPSSMPSKGARRILEVGKRNKDRARKILGHAHLITNHAHLRPRAKSMNDKTVSKSMRLYRVKIALGG